MANNQKIKASFRVSNKRFVIEYTLFKFNNLKCVHVEFAQGIGPFSAQFTMNNMSDNKAISVLRRVVDETISRCNDFDMVIFTSLDGNIKRDAIYGRIASNTAKRYTRELYNANMNASDGKLFVIHKNCFNATLDKDLQLYLEKNGLLVISGAIIRTCYSISNFAKNIFHPISA